MPPTTRSHSDIDIQRLRLIVVSKIHFPLSKPTGSHRTKNNNNKNSETSAQ